MTEPLTLTPSRIGFMRSILASPQDDAIRLAYADYLEEAGPADDRERATIEFIQASCRVGGNPAFMSPAGYKWVDANWHRLVPSVVALHTAFDENHEPRIGWFDYRLFHKRRHLNGDGRFGITWARDGRRVVAHGYMVLDSGDRTPFRFEVELWRGFAQCPRGWAVGGHSRRIKDAWRKDIPFILKGTRRH